jgi:hypothetical protein
LTDVRTFLIAFGRDVVHSQTDVAIGATLPTPAPPSAPQDGLKTILARAKAMRESEQNVAPAETTPGVQAPLDGPG